MKRTSTGVLDIEIEESMDAREFFSLHGTAQKELRERKNSANSGRPSIKL